MGRLGKPSDHKAQGRRVMLTRKIADILLADGVAQAPLRELGARMGVSDRVLLYYFRDKADLIEASLSEVIARFGAILDPLQPPGRHPAADVLRTSSQLLSLPALVPFMQVWADIVARGARGEEPFRTIARSVVQGSLASMELRLAIEDAKTRTAAAAAILAIVEGVWTIERACPGSTGGVLAFVESALQGKPAS